MSDLIKQVTIFKNAAENRAKNAAEIIKLNTGFDFFSSSEKDLNKTSFELLTTPYTNKNYHYDAVWYPFYHFTKLLFDLVRLARAVGFAIQAVVSEDPDTEQLADEALGLQGAAVAFDFLNLILSSISLITRTVASIVQGGYAAHLAGKQTREQLKAGGLGGVFAATAGYCAEKVTEFSQWSVESQISDKTFRFI